MIQKLTELKGKTDSSMIVGDFNTSVSIMAIRTRQKINDKET